MEATQVSIHKRIPKQNMTHPYNGVLFSLENGRKCWHRTALFLVISDYQRSQEFRACGLESICDVGNLTASEVAKGIVG